MNGAQRDFFHSTFHRLDVHITIYLGNGTMHKCCDWFLFHKFKDYMERNTQIGKQNPLWSKV